MTDVEVPVVPAAIAYAEEKSKLDVLLKILEGCSAGERAIKEEENKWVTFVFAYYGGFLAVLGLMAKEKFFGSSGKEGGDLGWFFGPGAVLALLGHVLFVRTFAMLRLTYYRVRGRMLRVLDALRVADRAVWSPRPIQDSVRHLTNLKSVEEWWQYTSPKESFFGRLGLLLMGHLPTWHLLEACLDLKHWYWHLAFAVVGYAVVLWTTWFYIAMDARDFLDRSSIKMSRRRAMLSVLCFGLSSERIPIRPDLWKTPETIAALPT